MVVQNYNCTIVIEGSDARIEGTFPVEVVVDATSYFFPGYKFTTRFKNGRWDGRVKLFSKVTRTFPAGLAQTVLEALREVHVQVQLDDLRYCPNVPVSFPQSLPGASFDYPYDYQPLCAWEMARRQRGVIGIAVNGGKTACAALFIAATKIPTLFMVPNLTLLYQTQKAMAKYLDLKLDDVGLIGDNHWEPKPWVTVATANTLYARLSTPACVDFLKSIQVVFCDECFIAGTKIDGKPIEEIKVGDSIRSFNEKTGQIENCFVEKVLVSKPKMLVRVKINGISLICTPGHPFWTQRGWVPALALLSSDMVLHTTQTQKGGSHANSEMQLLWKRISNCYRVESVEILKQTSDGTFGGLCPKGLVYNLHVKKNHTYLAENFVVHNCHRVGSTLWYTVMRSCNAFWRFGLSGTAFRRSDGADLRLVGVTGPVIYEVKNKELIRRKISVQPIVHMLKITKPSLPEKLPYREVHKLGIVENPYRNNDICLAVSEFVEQGLNVLITVDEIKHGEILDKRLWTFKQKLFIPHQFVNGSEIMEIRNKALADFERGDLRVLIATNIFSEGLNLPNIDVLALAGGGKAAITLLQRIGRGLRRGGNTEYLHIIDTADFQHRYLLLHSLQRIQEYKDQDCFEIEVAT